MAYQLMTPHSNCILVHERAEADKATEAAELHRVSSMLAAGWGASSTVMAALDLHADARLALEQAVALGVSTEQAWLILAGWVYGRNAERSDPAAAAALQPALASVDATLLAQCMALFDRVLGAYESDRWTLTRTRRLQRAMTLPLAG